MQKEKKSTQSKQTQKKYKQWCDRIRCNILLCGQTPIVPFYKKRRNYGRLWPNPVVDRDDDDYHKSG